MSAATRALAQVFVATMEDPAAPPQLADVEPDARWEFAVLLVAVALRTGWTPPTT